jgi:hypothetical protein
MNKHQALALEQHCRLGCETAMPQFHYLEAGGLAGIVLTVNSGYE